MDSHTWSYQCWPISKDLHQLWSRWHPVSVWTLDTVLKNWQVQWIIRMDCKRESKDSMISAWLNHHDYCNWKNITQDSENHKNIMCCAEFVWIWPWKIITHFNIYNTHTCTQKYSLNSILKSLYLRNKFSLLRSINL